MIIEWFMSVNQPGGGVSIPFDPRDEVSAQGAVLIADALLKEKIGLDPNRQWSVLAYRPFSVVPVDRGEPTRKWGWMNHPMQEWEFPTETL